MAIVPPAPLMVRDMFFLVFTNRKSKNGKNNDPKTGHVQNAACEIYVVTGDCFIERKYSLIKIKGKKVDAGPEAAQALALRSCTSWE